MSLFRGVTLKRADAFVAENRRPSQSCPPFVHLKDFYSKFGTSRNTAKAE